MEEKREIIYSDISSASRKQPYDAMVYLEGDQVIAIDGDGKIIAKGVAGEDDSRVIQAAIDRKGHIYFDSGEYHLTGRTYEQSVFVGSDTKISGAKTAVLNCAVYGLVIAGQKTDITTAPVDDMPVTTSTFDVVDASQFSIGDYVLINSDRKAYYSKSPYGEILRIRNIVDDTLTLDAPTKYYYNLSDTPVIRKLNMVSNVTVSDIEIHGPDETSATIGIYATFARNVTISNTKVHHIGEAGILFLSSIDCKVDGCEIYSCKRPGWGYGVSIGNAACDIVVSNNIMYNMGNHCVAIGGSYVDGYPTNITYCGNTFHNTAYPIDSHYGGNVVYSNNHITCTGGAMDVGAENVIITGCVFHNVGGCAIVPRAEYGMLRNLTVDNCTFENVGSAIHFWNIASLETLSVTNCKINNVSGTGIVFRNIYSTVYSTDSTGETGGVQDTRSVIVTGNTLSNIGTDAVRIETKNDGNINYANISNNSVQGYGLNGTGMGLSVSHASTAILTGNFVADARASGIAQSAIAAKSSLRAILSNNHVHDYHGYGLYASGCTRVQITNNIVSGEHRRNYNTYAIILSYLSESGAAIISGNDLTGLAEGIGSNTNRGLYIENSPNPKVVIFDNIFGTPHGFTPSANNIIHSNVGYVTENSGVASNVADGGTIAHGCVTTPTKVILTGSIAGEMVSVAGVDATNITVSIKKQSINIPEGGGDPTLELVPGTQQTIYWRAEV